MGCVSWACRVTCCVLGSENDEVSAAAFGPFRLIIFFYFPFLFLIFSQKSLTRVASFFSILTLLMPSSSLVPVRSGDEVSVSGLGAVSLPSGHSGWGGGDREDHSLKGPNWNRDRGCSF